MTLEIFSQLSLILIVAVLISFLMRWLKQPLIIGYILTGMIISPFAANLIIQQETITHLAQFGIAFLLFIVGLNLNPRIIKEVGGIALITGLGQIIFTSLIGFLIALALGFNPVTAIYIAIALTFSSTIIIVKLLSDKGDLDTLYGKIAIGFLIVQDLVAMIILMIVSSLSTEFSLTNFALITSLKAIILILALFLLAAYLLPPIVKFIARSQEFLFLFSLGWCFTFAAVFAASGFSMEIGALLAGISLSMSNYHLEIVAKIKPLRDFFIVIFFVLLGFEMHPANIPNIILPAAIFSIFIIIGNPLVVIALMGGLGYTKRNGFLAGLTVAQISEFSLILIALGISVGHLASETLSLVTLVGIITITGSTYLIMYADKIYPHLAGFLNFFERKRITLKDKTPMTKNYDTILFGYNRIGFNLLQTLNKIKSRYLVVDFNPEIIKILSAQGVNCLYGDADDFELLAELNFKKAKIIASTIPDYSVNGLLIDETKRRNPKATVIVTARQISEALKLYDLGADYVILPHFLGGRYVADLIEKAQHRKKIYHQEQKNQIKELKERLAQGQEHPQIERLQQQIRN